MFCSFKRKSKVGSNVKIVSLKTGNIIQTIPPSNKYTVSSKKDGSEKETFSFIQSKKKKMLAPDVEDYDLMARDHVITFNTIDLMSFKTTEELSEDGSDPFDRIHVVTGHASGLMKEWFVSEETETVEEGQDETDIPLKSSDMTRIKVTLKRTWRSFHQSPITVVKFSELPYIQGFVASGGSSDSIIKVWDLNQGFCTHSLRLKSGTISTLSFHSMILSKARRYFMIGSGDISNEIQVFDLETSQKTATLEGHQSTVTSIVFINETTMISTSRDKIMITWNLETFTAVKQFPIFESIEDVIIRTVGSNSQVAITVGNEGMIRLVNPSTGKILASAKTSSHGVSFPLKQIAACGEQIVSVSDQNHIAFHSVVSSEDEISILTERQLVGELDQVLCAKFIGDKQEHLVVASNSPLIKIYSLKNRNSCQVFAGHDDIVLSIHDVSWNRNLFISSSKDNSIKIWKFSVDEKNNTFDAIVLSSGSGHFRSVTAVSVCKKIASGFMLSGSEDSFVKVWRIPKSLIQGNVNEVTPGQQLVSMASVKVHDKDVNSIAVAPNDQLIATGSKDKTCKLWSIDSKSKQLSLITTLRGHKRTVWSIDFSPVDKILLTASADCTMKIWSLSDYSCLRTMSVDKSSVYLFAKFISNGTQVIASSSDALVRVFSVKTAELVLTLDPVSHARVVTDLSPSTFRTAKKNQITEDANAEDADEEDDDRIWSLDFNSNEKVLVFGSGPRVFLFEDNTSEAENEFQTKRNQQVIYDQKLQNLLQGKKYDKALKVAINLDQPGRCLDILREISLTHVDDQIRDDDDEDEDNGDKTERLFGMKKLENLLDSLRDDQLYYLLNQAAMKWNTNSKNCIFAQVVMKVCLPRVIKEVIKDDSSQDLSTLAPMIEAMICFTERHEARLKKQLVSNHLLQFLGESVMKSLPMQDLSLGEKIDMETEELRTPINLVAPQANVTPRKETIEIRTKITEQQRKSFVDVDDGFDDLSSGEETELPKRQILGEEDEKTRMKKLMKKKLGMKKFGRKKMTRVR